MSKTDKDRPFWVQNQEHGLIDHDHRDGMCVISDDQRDKWNSWHNHWRHCKKRRTVEFNCTKNDPHKNYRGQTCWMYKAEFPDAPYEERNVRWIQCIGHSKTVTDEDVPCACDDKPDRPTCFPSWKIGRYYHHGGVPSWFVREVYHRPERAREQKLKNMAREYNANGDIEDYDFENRQAKNSARWMWW